MYRANPYEATRLFGAAGVRGTVYSRLEGLAQHDQTVGHPWTALREAFYGEHASSLLVVDYELLSRAPAKVLPLVYDFLGEPYFEHDFENVEYDADKFNQMSFWNDKAGSAANVIAPQPVQQGKQA
jgi:sulfotransferase